MTGHGSSLSAARGSEQMMRIVSLNVGLPRTLLWKGREITTGIFKEPAKGPVMLRQLNLDGDRQADLTVHGGPVKAVYAYPSEHYDFWRKELPEAELPWGMFGENLTTEGLSENGVCAGDHFRIGGAVVMATQPRIPCYKLTLKFGRDDIIERFLRSGRSGFYLSVLEEGLVTAGDTIERIHRDEGGVTVADLNRLHANGKEDISLMRRAVRVKGLSEGWRNRFLKQLATFDGSRCGTNRKNHTEI
jgi:MOSC domain-containing protein YiiM